MHNIEKKNGCSCFCIIILYCECVGWILAILSLITIFLKQKNKLLSSFKLMEWKVGVCVWKIRSSEKKHLPKVFRKKNLGKKTKVIYARKFYSEVIMRGLMLI